MCSLVIEQVTRYVQYCSGVLTKKTTRTTVRYGSPESMKAVNLAPKVLNKSNFQTSKTRKKKHTSSSLLTREENQAQQEKDSFCTTTDLFVMTVSPASQQKPSAEN